MDSSLRQTSRRLYDYAKLLEGSTITRKLFRTILHQEIAKMTTRVIQQAHEATNYKTAGELLDVLVTGDGFPEFMTLLAYNYL